MPSLAALLERSAAIIETTTRRDFEGTYDETPGAHMMTKLFTRLAGWCAWAFGHPIIVMGREFDHDRR